MTFKAWLRAHSKDVSNVGDFARDALKDRALWRTHAYGCSRDLLNHLWERRACHAAKRAGLEAYKLWDEERDPLERALSRRFPGKRRPKYALLDCDYEY